MNKLISIDYRTGFYIDVVGLAICLLLIAFLSSAAPVILAALAFATSAAFNYYAAKGVIYDNVRIAVFVLVALCFIWSIINLALSII